MNYLCGPKRGELRERESGRRKKVTKKKKKSFAVTKK